jgi:hypothetical protein
MGVIFAAVGRGKVMACQGIDVKKIRMFVEIAKSRAYNGYRFITL